MLWSVYLNFVNLRCGLSKEEDVFLFYSRKIIRWTCIMDRWTIIWVTWITLHVIYLQMWTFFQLCPLISMNNYFLIEGVVFVKGGQTSSIWINRCHWNTLWFLLGTFHKLKVFESIREGCVRSVHIPVCVGRTIERQQSEILGYSALWHLG
jgi:hypothetical protein